MRRGGDHDGWKKGVHKSHLGGSGRELSSYRHKDKIKDKLVRNAQWLERKYCGRRRVSVVR